jgi:hypothetical protein
LHRIFIWFTAKWARQDSNLRPTGYEPAALPLSYEPTLSAMNYFTFHGNYIFMERETRRTRDTLLGRNSRCCPPFPTPFELEKQEKTTSFRYQSGDRFFSTSRHLLD